MNGEAKESPTVTCVDDGAGLYVELTNAPLDLSRLTFQKATHPQCGAVSSFVGTTRDHSDGKQVLHLEYVAYHSMALSKLREIGSHAFSGWPGIHRVVISHRLGVVPIGDASVAIAVASEHRKEGLEAVRWVINELKAAVPIWKRETYADTSDPKWKANSEFWERFGGVPSPPMNGLSSNET